MSSPRAPAGATPRAIDALPRPVLVAVSSMNALGLSKSQPGTLIGGRRPFFVPDAHPNTPSSGTSTPLRVRQRQVNPRQLSGTGQMSEIF
jgi:hypothetical protein